VQIIIKLPSKGYDYEQTMNPTIRRSFDDTAIAMESGFPMALFCFVTGVICAIKSDFAIIFYGGPAP
jgi:hypothetical protein